MSDELRSIKVVGGTFAIGLWLFLIMLELGDILEALNKIADHMK